MLLTVSVNNRNIVTIWRCAVLVLRLGMRDHNKRCRDYHNYGGAQCKCDNFRFKFFKPLHFIPLRFQNRARFIFFFADRSTPTPALWCFENGHAIANFAHIFLHQSGYVPQVPASRPEPRGYPAVERGALPESGFNPLQQRFSHISIIPHAACRVKPYLALKVLFILLVFNDFPRVRLLV